MARYLLALGAVLAGRIHPFEKVADHWARQRWKGTRGFTTNEAHGGMDVTGRTKTELLALARRLGIRGRSRMGKRELVRAVSRAR